MSEFSTVQLKTMLVMLVKKYGIDGQVTLTRKEYEALEQRIGLRFKIGEEDMVIELLQIEQVEPKKPHLHLVH